MDLLWFVLGLTALVAGAELLVRGAARLALTLGISPLVVGLTVVAFGTSSPEVAVSVGAAFSGQIDVAVGNVVGSNIFNVLFILGLSALITPLLVHAQLIRQEVPIMIGVSVLFIALAVDGAISRFDAALMIGLLLVYTVFLVVQSRRQNHSLTAQMEDELPPARRWDAHWAVQVLLIIAGLSLLVLGSRWLVDAATAFAKAMGVSELVIGLTIVAAGTSMPEVATSIMAALRSQRDIAVGNVVGSNIFNILGCLGLSGLVAADGLPVAAAALNFDIWIMLAVALACLPVFITGHEIARWEGGVFFGYYIAYTVYLILAANQHEALEMYSTTMLVFVVPLTLITLAVTLWRHRSQTA